MGLIRDLQLKRIKLGETRLSEDYGLLTLLKSSGIETVYDLLRIKSEQMRAWRNQRFNVNLITDVAEYYIQKKDKL